MVKLTNKQHEQHQDRRINKLEKRADADDNSQKTRKTNYFSRKTDGKTKVKIKIDFQISDLRMTFPSLDSHPIHS